jgi:hypothetical protein
MQTLCWINRRQPNGRVNMSKVMCIFFYRAGLTNKRYFGTVGWTRRNKFVLKYMTFCLDQRHLKSPCCTRPFVSYSNWTLFINYRVVMSLRPFVCPYRIKKAKIKILYRECSESRRGMGVYCECCVLSGRGLYVGLITRPEESYPVWFVWVWSWSLDNEEDLAHWGLLRHWKKKANAQFYLKITVFWDITQCWLVICYRCFGRTCCLHLLCSRRREV